MRMKTKRAIRFALASLLAFGTASCWMPSFDPALSLSLEMDGFFGERGLETWRIGFDFTVKDDRWTDGAEFLPLRDPALVRDGGFLVRKDPFSIAVAKLSIDPIEGPMITWSWQDGNPLGTRALIEPHLSATDDLLLLRDPYRGVETLSTYNPEPCPCGSLVYEGKSLIAYGTETLNEAGSENQIRVSVVVGSDYDGLVDAGYGQANIGAYSPGWSNGVSYLPKASALPGWAVYDAALGDEPWALTLDPEDPGLWRFGVPVDPATAGNAARIGGIESLGTATVHAGSSMLILAEGRVITDIYDLSGKPLGWLPTGSWRFAFEYWDDAGLRWISVFTRFAVLTENHDDPEGNLAFAQVEGVPTADLLAFAAEKLGN